MTKRARPFSIQDYSDARKQAVGPLTKFGINSPEPKPSPERIAELKQEIEDAQWIIANWDAPEVKKMLERDARENGGLTLESVKAELAAAEAELKGKKP